MTRLGLAAAFGLFGLGVALLGGCHGSSSSTNTITIEIIPPVTGTSVDVGTTAPLNFTAQLGDDTKNEGVTWKLSGTSCSGDGCGTLSNEDKLSVSYTPPPAPLPSSAALTVTLTATSMAQTSVTKTATITVEPLPTFTTTGCNPPIPTGTSQICGLTGASNGRSYNQAIQISGGVAPYTFTILSSNPSPLSSLCLNLTVTQTTSTSTALAGKPCNGGTTATAVTFTLQVTDSGGAAPVTQQYSMSIAAAPPLSITTPSLNAASLNTQYNQTVSFSGGVTPITWSVSPPAASSLPPGLSFNSTNGQITGIPTAAGLTGSSCTPTVPGQYCFSVTLSDSAILPNNPPPGYHNQTQTQAYSITVQQPGPLSITTPAGSLASGTTGAGYSATIGATGAAQPYSWSVTQGQLPPGLTLAGTQSGNAVISGVPSVIGNYTFTVQVSDAELPPATQTKSAQYSISVSGGQDNNSLFRGSYSFIFRGFDKDGSMAMIGTLTSDGNGNIVGAEAINRLSGVAPVASVSGTYTIDSVTSGTSNGASGDGRGLMQLTTTVAQQSVTAEYELTLESDGSIQFMQIHDYPSPAPTNPDAFATHGAGVMKPVIGGGFSAASFGGNYAFEFTGEDTGKMPDALAGFVHANPSAQTLTSGTCDFNDAGNYGTQSISGEFSFTPPFGAAEMTLEVPKSGQQTVQFEYVFVSSSEMYFLETDSTGATNTPTLYRLSGEMILQSPNTTFDMNSLSGAAVTTASGVDRSGDAIVSAGLVTSTVCDGSTANTLALDQNDNGTIASVVSPALSETCTVNSTNGRVAFNWQSPTVAPPFVTAYLVGPGEGFIIGNDATVTTGLIELQTATAPFSNSSMTGAYAIGAPFIAESGVDNLTGQTVADGLGDLAGTVDEADASGASQTLNQPFTASITSVGANGRGTMTTTGTVPTGYPTNWIFYFVSPSQIRAIPADSGTQHPQLIFLGPTP